MKNKKVNVKKGTGTFSVNWTELGLNTATGAWSGGASTIGGAIIRGGVASGTNESYNQVFNVNNSMDNKLMNIAIQAGVGLGTGLLIGGAGKVGNYIIIPKEQINMPVTTGARTLKLPLESAAGIGGGIVMPKIINVETSDE
jgi:hypothetical protein